MASNISQFEKDLSTKGHEKFVRQVTEFYKSLVLTTFQYVSSDVMTTGKSFGSPVATGRFYNSHTIRIGSVDPRVKPEGKYKSGIPLSQAAAAIANLKLSDIVFIANSLPYARRIEFEGWSSVKAPHGVYRVAANLVKVKFKNVTVT